jgi:pimeloyl-ACP methyl ester carboxylesterase
VVWGHSQGGQAALWTGIIGPRYAPDIQIAGVAAIAPGTNLFAMSVEVDKRVGPYVALSYSRFYPDVTFEQSVRPEALAAAREMANLCSWRDAPEDLQRLAALARSFDGRALATSTNAALAARLTQNTPDHSIASPLVIAQGLADIVVPPPATEAFIDERCAAGQRLEYWAFAGLDHLGIAGLVQPSTSLDEPLVAWTTARFAKEPQPSGCARKSF